MSVRQSKPLDFLVIGVAKSGTTSLFHYLNEHPRIYLPSQKEVPFFSNDQLFERGWEAFVDDYFQKANVDLLWGKITPDYMRIPRIVSERIYRLMPKIKLIAILRNPIERAFSYHRMAVNRGWATLSSKNFAELVSREVTRDSKKMGNRENYVTIGQYARILKMYLDYFPAEQISIIFSEDLLTKRAAVLDSILNFLGLPEGFVPSNLGKVFHKGGEKLRFLRTKSVLQKIGPLRRIWKALPNPRRQAIKFWFAQKNTVPGTHPPIDPELRQKLADYYREDVFVLERMLGRKVPWSDFNPTGHLQKAP